jgi:hypothetical protein
MPDIAFERVLPDTNVWLDAAFCPDSVARRALTILRAAGLPLYLEDLTEREAISVLNKRKLALGLTFDCRQYFFGLCIEDGLHPRTSRTTWHPARPCPKARSAYCASRSSL